VTERLKKDIIKLVIDEVVIESESVKIFATIPLPNKIHEREMDKTDIPGTFNAGATLGPVNETNMNRIWNKHKQTNTPLKRKVFVGLSGGVDSAVSAGLLKKENYNVVGAFIRGWYPDFITCTWREDRQDAMRVCATLGIPFLEIDLEKEYKEGVANYMIEEYKIGRTPNPDVMCNKVIKFGAFFKKAQSLGATYIATGHYAQRNKLSSNIYELQKGEDEDKDQSYFLWTIGQEQLSKTFFPIGHLKKGMVRRLAKKFQLPVADKKDSQGICFLGKLDVKDFLKHYIPTKKGNVLNEEGLVIGYHSGASFLTIGERHGFTITEKGNNEKPFYVISKDIKENTITVSHDVNFELKKENILLQHVNWIASIPDENKEYQCQIRYHGKEYPCHIKQTKVQFINEVPLVASGQSIVIYDKSICVGGGVVV